MQLQLVQWEKFAPDFDDNRERAAKGEPAVVVEVRPPSYRIWSRFWQAMSLHPRPVPPHIAADVAGSEDEERTITGLTLYLATLDDGMASILWHGCVGKVTWPDSLTPGFSPKTGEELWAARDNISSFKLFQSVLEAIINKARLNEGLVSFLASARGQQALDREVNIKGGTAQSVESAA